VIEGIIKVVIVKNKPVANVNFSDGNYRLPGGAVEENETDIECLERELKQELGVEELISISKNPIESYSYQNPRESYHKNVRVYVARVDDATINSIKMNKDELLGIIVLNPLKAIQKLHYSMEKRAMRRFYNIKTGKKD
jgi:8-oxo-dGTP diphosphatase